MSWQLQNPIDPKVMSDARKTLHYYIQAVAAAGRSHFPDDPGDVYASMEWSPEHNAFMGKHLTNGIRFGLIPATLEGIVRTEDNDLHYDIGKGDMTSFQKWIREMMEATGLNSGHYGINLPYRIPAYDTKDLVVMETHSEAFRELGILYSNACEMLVKIGRYGNASQVVCWPHHFDMAITISIDEDPDPEFRSSIGIGLSPGDEQFGQPYYYLSTWPKLSSESGDSISISTGSVISEGWTGTALFHESIVSLGSPSEQEDLVYGFLRESYSELVDLMI